jgi:hypothetical protein
MTLLLTEKERNVCVKALNAHMERLNQRVSCQLDELATDVDIAPLKREMATVRSLLKKMARAEA